jgi:DsbE subfamily thiol:disulfide oxidoreductase
MKPSKSLGITLGFIAAAFPAFAHTSAPRQILSDPVQVVRAVMRTPNDKIDLARAKLTFDKLYDPTTDIAARLKQIDAMAQAVRTMAGPSAPPRLRLTMLRKYIYDAGPWNHNEPFQYDLTDPFGHKPANKLLSTYLATHRGNCVSMPILFAALAQRLGLNATLSTAPGHMFVKYTDDVTGKTFNLEATSGASPARDVWIRHLMPMTDRAVATGLYMKTLSRKEALAVMAGIVLERAFAEQKYQTAWDVAEVLRPYYPNNLTVLLAPADAAVGLIQEEYLSKYPRRSDIPPELTQRLVFLEQTVSGALNRAHALGWRETDGEEKPSALIGSAAPKLELPSLGDATKGFGPRELRSGHVTVVNAFASWCVECYREAPILAKLARRGDFALYGLAWKDASEKIRGFLAANGNPYRRIALDADGSAGIAWGIGGVPETFVIDAHGIVRVCIPGELTGAVVARELLPAVAAVRRRS